MEHPDEGMIRAFLDGEVSGGGEDLRAHLAGCTPCAEAGEAQRASWKNLSDAFSLLDVEAPEESARGRILEEARKRKLFGRWVRRNLAKAASITVLLTAGAAAALPGSPVRRLVGNSLEAVFQGDQAVSPASAEDPGEGVGTGDPRDPSLVGATISALSGPLALKVEGLEGTATLRVLLVEGDQAGIFAGEGTRFRTVSGELLASGPPGEVFVEIPLSATGVTVSVNGELYLAKTEGGLEILGPVRTRTPTEIRFGPSGSEDR